MSVVLLPKYRFDQAPEEDPEVVAARLHAKKNKAHNPAEDVEFPPYQYFEYPRAMYRLWDPEAREIEVLRVAGKHMLDLSKPLDRRTADQLVGQYETREVGAIDFVRIGNPTAGRIEVISEIREKNDREHAALLEQGWADRPEDARAAARAFEMRTKSGPAAQLLYEDRHLSETAKAEFDAVNEAADDHVVSVDETRAKLRDAGRLPKEKR